MRQPLRAVLEVRLSLCATAPATELKARLIRFLAAHGAQPLLAPASHQSPLVQSSLALVVNSRIEFVSAYSDLFITGHAADDSRVSSSASTMRTEPLL